MPVLTRATTSMLLTCVAAAPAFAQGLTEFQNGQVANANAVNANFQVVQSAANAATDAANAAANAATNAQATADSAAAAAASAQSTANSANSTANSVSSSWGPFSSRLGLSGVNVGTTGVDSALFAETNTVIFARDRRPRFGQGAGAPASWGFSSDGVIIESGLAESGGFFANGDTAVIWSPGDGNLLTIYDEDIFGLATAAPSSYLGNNAAWYASGYNTISDQQFKTNIQPLHGALDRVMRVTGFTYDLRPETLWPGDVANSKPIAHENFENQIGFVAQDLQKVMPELVHYSDSMQALTVNYDGMIPVLVEAIKEQQAQIEALRAELQQLRGN